MAIALALVFAIGAIAPIMAHDKPNQESPPTGVSTGAAFMQIANDGDVDDRLIGASSDAAKSTEIHETSEVNGVMQMRHMRDGLKLRAGSTVTLEPGGYHIMLIGLSGDLTAGASYKLTLEFEVAGVVDLDVPVFANQAEADAADPVATVKAGDLNIHGFWSRQAPALNNGHDQDSTHGHATPAVGGSAMAASTGAVFMTIVNGGENADRLVAIVTVVAETVEIHDIVAVDGVMHMRPLTGGLELPAGSEFVLEPGGHHLMLIGLTVDLLPGETFELTLTFEQAGIVTVESTVVTGNEKPGEGLAEPVLAGAITVLDVWSRSAPAMT